MPPDPDLDAFEDIDLSTLPSVELDPDMVPHPSDLGPLEDIDLPALD